MSTTVDPKEIEFAQQVRRALDETANALPEPTLERLSRARQAAMARKKAAEQPRMALVPAFAGAGAGLGAGASNDRRQSGRRGLSWQRFGLLVPLTALVVTLSGIAHIENQRRVNEKADIDAAMLSDDLPLNAYVDHGFHAYLSLSR
jgi:hypothetical protein